MLSAMCNALQCTTIRNHLEFSRSCTSVASLRPGSTTDARFVPLVTCLRATGTERSETRILENGESQRKSARERERERERERSAAQEMEKAEN